MYNACFVICHGICIYASLLFMHAHCDALMFGRYYNTTKGIKDPAMRKEVPANWVDGAWEVFCKFGAPGSNEAWLLAESAPRKAGSSRKAVKAEQVAHAKAKAKEDKADGEAAKEDENELAKMVTIMVDVKASLDKNNEFLARVAENEDKQTRMQAIKLALEHFPSTSQEYQDAVNDLKELNKKK